jgi:hypothetical protein
VKATKSAFKSAGAEFASEFSGVIRSEVLPAARGLAMAVKGASDELAVFSKFMIELVKSVPGLGNVVAMTQAAGEAGDDVSNTAALDEGIGNVPGINDIFTTLDKQLARVRGKFRRGVIPKKEMLKEIESYKMEAMTKLQKLKQEVPGVFPPNLIDSVAKELRKVQDRLDAIDTQKVLEKFRQRVNEAIKPQTQPQTESPEAAGPGDTSVGTQELAYQPAFYDKVDTKVTSLRKKLGLTKKEMRRVSASFQRFGRRAGQAFGRAATEGENFLSSIGNLLQELIGQLAKLAVKKGITSVFSTLGILGGPAGGAITSFLGQGVGSIFGGFFADGGVVRDTTLGVMGEYSGSQSNPEIVSPESKMRDVFASTLQSKGAAAGMNVTVNVQGESRVEGSDIRTSYNTQTRVDRRQGRK